MEMAMRPILALSPRPFLLDHVSLFFSPAMNNDVSFGHFFGVSSCYGANLGAILIN